MAEERSQQRLSASGLFDRVHDGLGQGVDVIGDVVGQVGVFRVRPDLLDRVEVGGVDRKPLHLDLGTKAALQPSRWHLFFHCDTAP